MEWNCTIKDLFDYLIATLLKFSLVVIKSSWIIGREYDRPVCSWASALSALKPFRHLFNVLRLLNQLIILNILTPRAPMSLKIYTGLYTDWVT